METLTPSPQCCQSMTNEERIVQSFAEKSEWLNEPKFSDADRLMAVVSNLHGE